MLKSIFFTITTAIGVTMQIICMGKLLEKRTSVRIIPFIIAGTIVTVLPIPQPAAMIIIWLILFAYAAMVLRSSIISSVMCSALPCWIIRLCYGLSGSITTITAPFLFSQTPRLAGNILMIFGEIAALALFGLCCKIICGILVIPQNNDEQNRFSLVILIPNILIFMITEYIFNTFYSAAHTDFPLFEKAIPLLFVQALGIISVFCILFSYKKLCEYFSVRKKLAVSEQQNHFQRQYVTEAKSRYEFARSFRHDIKNHLSVLRGLLKKRDYSRAEKYLNELDGAFAKTSFHYQTGLPIVDIILENKSSNNIRIDCELQIPPNNIVLDADWCTLFANALDNAVCACSKLSSETKPRITVSGKTHGDLLLICIQNPFDGGEFKRGTGLENIAQTAEKYNGEIEISTGDNIFTLEILLNISQR